MWCLVRAASWIIDGAFSQCPHMVKGARQLSGASFIRPQTALVGALPSWPSQLPKSSSPSTWGLGFHFYIWCHGRQIPRPQHYHIIYNTVLHLFCYVSDVPSVYFESLKIWIFFHYFLHFLHLYLHLFRPMIEQKFSIQLKFTYSFCLFVYCFLFLFLFSSGQSLLRLGNTISY